MSIVAYTGLPGSGKSHGVVEFVILPAVKAGREVWTNIPLNLDAWNTDYPGHRIHIFDVKDMLEDPRWCLDVVPAGSVFVLDEAWRVWPSGQKNTAPEYKTFLAEHRHRVGKDGMTSEIVVVTQNLRQVGSFVRDMVESTTITKKHTSLGSSKRYVVAIYSGAVAGDKAPDDRLNRKQQSKYKPEIFRLYQSHTMSTTGSAGAEKKADNRGVIWKSAGVLAIPVAALVVIGGVWWTFHSFFAFAGQSDPTPQAKSQSRLTPAGAIATSSPPGKPAVVKPRDSATWRLTGTITTPKGVRVLLSDGKGNARMMTDKSCKQFADTGEVYCYVDGERVTSWSGNRPSGLMAVGTALVAPAT